MLEEWIRILLLIHCKDEEARLPLGGGRPPGTSSEESAVEATALKPWAGLLLDRGPDPWGGTGPAAARVGSTEGQACHRASRGLSAFGCY